MWAASGSLREIGALLNSNRWSTFRKNEVRILGDQPVNPDSPLDRCMAGVLPVGYPLVSAVMQLRVSRRSATSTDVVQHHWKNIPFNIPKLWTGEYVWTHSRLSPIYGHEIEIEIMIRHQMLFLATCSDQDGFGRASPGSLHSHCGKVNSISWKQTRYCALSQKLNYITGLKQCHKPPICVWCILPVKIVSWGVANFCFTHISGCQMHCGIHSSKCFVFALTNASHTGVCICPWHTSHISIYIYI